jgi:aminoglycoside/choline kinase family phosphotransferase
MQTILERIKALFSTYSILEINSIERLPLSGSDRIYYRIFTPATNYIATVNLNVKENETFFYFSEHFLKAGCPVPKIYAIEDSREIYIQQDFGNVSLLDVLEREGYTDHVYDLFKKSVRELATLQIKGDENLDYSRCLTSKEFGKQAIVADLLYFKYYFVDTLKIAYDKEELADNFEALATYLSFVDHKYFMFRDFQARNIMVENDQVRFIDYQGGMKGALQYDVASMLWQAKAMLSINWKDSLFTYYMDCVEEILGSPIGRTRFESQYNGYVLIRLLQVLGAYGFRGLFERKAHFLTSIPLALRNLKWFLENKDTGIVLHEFERILRLIIKDEVISKFEPIQANEQTPLVVKVNSFSYKIGGIPVDETNNGGGFVFDCRGMLNPGRYEEYKHINGRDKSVKDFLEQHTKMPEFLNSVYNIIDIAVEDYIKRGFESLMISFGCTGGCHRSVYAADAVVRHLRNKFGVKVELHHIEQKIRDSFPPSKIG